MRRIDGPHDIAEGLEALCALDPRLRAVRARAGEVPLRRTGAGFASLAAIVVAQQVSRASADAIFGRLSAALDPLTPESVLAASGGIFRDAGLSRAKIRTLLALAEAAGAGLDLDGVCALEAQEAVSRLTAVPGIGPWTAECYLLFAAGHADVFPARDVALQTAVGHALAISPRPAARELAALAKAWRPWRGVASRLFWAYYRQITAREGAPPS